MSSVIIGLCAVISASFIGLWLKKRLIAKAVFYEDYYAYLLFATDKIAYERMPLGELNEAFAEKRCGSFSAFLKGEEQSLPVSEAALSDVKKYLTEMGKTDADTQIASLRGKSAEIKRLVEGDCVKYRKDGTLYFKLSVLFGVVLFIIFV